MKILLVEDDKKISEILFKFLSSQGYTVFLSNNTVSALQISKAEYPDLIILDLKLPDGNGLDILPEIKKYSKEIIVVTAHGGISDVVKAMKYGIFDFIEKPIDLIYLKNTVFNINKFIYEKKSFDFKTDFIGESSKVKHLKDKINLIANKNVPVLIKGESGTGKEIVAQMIHEKSRRNKFIALNCGAIPEDLFEAELFGFEKGSFTSADSSKIGKIESADGGTLFLDEIGDMPYNLQVKLLRVLETKEVERIGSNRSKKIDVRIICATNSSLEEIIVKKKFREDLYFRIAVVEFDMPPLRERIGDIKILAQYFLNLFNKEHGLKIKYFSEGVLKVFESYNWPGNVRELKNTIQSLVVLNDKDYIDLSDLPEKFNINNQIEYLEVPLGLTLEEIEKKYIEKTIDYFDNNKTKAAKILNISKTTLFSKIKEKNEKEG